MIEGPIKITNVIEKVRRDSTKMSRKYFSISDVRGRELITQRFRLGKEKVTKVTVVFYEGTIKLRTSLCRMSVFTWLMSGNN